MIVYYGYSHLQILSKKDQAKTTSKEPPTSGGFAHHASNIMYRGLVLTWAFSSMHVPVIIWLVVTGRWLLISHILEMIIPIDVHIFQRDSNHQPVIHDLLLLIWCEFRVADARSILTH